MCWQILKSDIFGELAIIKYYLD